MEFDKSKILTVVTADQAKVGSKGYFSNYIPTLEGYVTGHIKPDKLTRVSLNTIYPFLDGHNYYSLFYPAPEPTYAERQAQWLKDNNLKVGSTIKVVSIGHSHAKRNPSGKESLIGTTNKIIEITDEHICIDWDIFPDRGCWLMSYLDLEPAKPEPTYAERQAEWIKENGLKVGDEVWITRPWEAGEDGADCAACYRSSGMVGAVVNVKEIREKYILIEENAFSTHLTCPYTALGIIKEPAYRPFKNAEEFKPYRDEWFKTKIEEARTARAMTVNYSDSGVVMCWYDIHGNPELGCISWDGFFQSFKRENGDPCGVREAALDE